MDGENVITMERNQTKIELKYSQLMKELSLSFLETMLFQLLIVRHQHHILASLASLLLHYILSMLFFISYPSSIESQPQLTPLRFFIYY